ncbi:MAG: anthranilate synthase component II [Pseudomonadota bacterium]
MTVLIDNYDSFTYNLVQYFGDLGVNCDVYRNDKISADDVIAKNPSEIIISPGPATPDEAGICLELIEKAARQNIPLLGICLGHQAIGQVFGATVCRAPAPIHGKIWDIDHNGHPLFQDIPAPAPFTRYHSLIVQEGTIGNELQITARSQTDNLVMGLSHVSKPIHGVQFHPESIASDHGKQLLMNFLTLAREHNR